MLHWNTGGLGPKRSRAGRELGPVRRRPGEELGLSRDVGGLIIVEGQPKYPRSMYILSIILGNVVAKMSVSLNAIHMPISLITHFDCAYI